MSVTQKLMAMGSFSVKLNKDAPEDLVNVIDFLGHIVITDAKVDAKAISDTDLLSQAQYVGVVIRKPIRDSLSVSGNGLLWWLGDDAERGLILKDGDKQVFVNETFNNGISDVINVVNSPITKGTVESPAGTFTLTLDLITQRRGIEQICGLFGAEFQVQNDFSLDAGASGFVFNGTASAVLMRKEIGGGDDPTTEGLPVDTMEVTEDAEDWISSAIVAGEGTGDVLNTEESTLASIPYKDPQGVDSKRSKIFNEPRLESAEALLQAAEYRDEFGVTRKEISVSLSDYHVVGSFKVGDLIYVYDPKSGLTDSANEVNFRGQVINPIAIRCVGKSFPISGGMGVYYRDTSGVYTELTEWVEFETGTTTIEIGVSRRALARQESEALSQRITVDPNFNDGVAPAQVVVSGTPWTGITYLTSEGSTASSIVAQWSEPLDGGGGAITDGDHYSVRFKTSGGSQYQYLNVPWGTTSMEISDLSPGVTYDIAISAVDNLGNAGSYSTTETVSAPNQVNAPSQPAAPTAAANALAIQIVHNLTKQGGGALESDVDHLKVYASTTSGFVPSNANRIGQIKLNQASITLGIDVVADFSVSDDTLRYVVVTAVNREGLESAKSIEASISADLIATSHISDLAVTTAKIADLNVTQAKIANLAVDTAQIASLAVGTAKIDNLSVTTAKIDALAVTEAKIDNLAVTNAKINDLDAGKINVGTLSADRIGASSIVAGKLSITSLDAITATMGTLTVDSTLTMSTGGLLRTASSGQRIEMSNTSLTLMAFYNSAGTAVTEFEYSNSLGQLRVNGLNVTGNDFRIYNFKNTDIEGSTQVTVWSTGNGNPLTLKAGNTVSAGIIYMYAGGTHGVRVGSTNLRSISSTTGNANIKINAAGTKALPTYSFVGATNTGMRLGTTTQIILSCGNVDELYLSNTQLVVPNVYNDSIAGSANVLVESNGRLRRATSALKYKTDVSDIDLADIDLRPVIFTDKENGTRHIGQIADDLARQDVRLGVYANGSLEDYDTRAILAVMVSKINRLEMAA